MGLNEAWAIFHDYYGKKQLTELDMDAFIEASEFLIFHEDLEDANRQAVLYNLASFYYDCEIYQLAEKYFLMLAEEYDYDGLTSGMAYTKLAKLYYYGHAGAPDYSKANEYIHRALDHDPDSLQAKVLALAIAKYDYGSLTEDEYFDAVFDLGNEVLDRNVPGVWSIPVPEIELLICEISLTNNMVDDVHDLLKDAKRYLYQRLLSSKDPDDLTLMKKIIDLDPIETPFTELTVYDLLWMLEDGDVEFCYNQKRYLLTASERALGKEPTIYFENKYYRSPEEFLRKAEIDGQKLNTIADHIDGTNWSEKPE